jgi:hypothetical protein
MSRLALFTVALLVLVTIGSQPRHNGSLSESINSMCVCVPARAELMMKSAMVKTQAEVKSVKLFAQRATATQ